MAASSQPVSFRVERHEVIEPDEDCLICGDEVAEIAENNSAGSMESLRCEVILSGPVNQPVTLQEFVHLTCHPSQAYHYGCLKGWLEQNASCPLDRRQVNSAAPSALRPGINKLGPTEQKIHQVALSIFFNK